METSGFGKILFHGESAEEAEDFIFAIKERAYAEGKQKDNPWIADFASICFAKKALRWYEELDEETQSDWKLLRRAILAKYAHAPSSGTIIPVAAPASPRVEATSVREPTLAAPPPVSGIKKGYIRVESPNLTLGYIGKALINNEWCTVVATKSEAVVFEYRTLPGVIRFQNDQEALAVQSHYVNLNLLAGSRSFCALFKGSEAMKSTVYRWSGPRLDNLWSIVDGNKLSAHWPTDEGGQWALEPVLYTVDRRLYMAVDAAAFAKGAEEEFYKPTTLRWERI